MLMADSMEGPCQWANRDLFETGNVVERQSPQYLDDSRTKSFEVPSKGLVPHDIGMAGSTCITLNKVAVGGLLLLPLRLANPPSEMGTILLHKLSRNLSFVPKELEDGSLSV
jgi:hypothetical protein